MATPRVETSPWTAPRRRAEALRDRHPFAEQQLRLYLALLDVWERSWSDARGRAPETIAGWAAGAVFPDVLETTVTYGPKPLADSLSGTDDGGAAALLAAFLAGEELEPVERYLARATLRGPLAAVDAALACAADPAPRGGRRCPRCAGPPQLSVRLDSGDALVSGRRELACARCAARWSYSGNTCAWCGETGRRTVYAERDAAPRVGRGAADGTFPHLRVEACANCSRYLIDIDLGRDPRAVPEVDELAAVPLDLYAVERGFSKITPNLMGF